MAVNATIPGLSRNPLNVREIADWDELERLRPEWEQILRSNPDLGLFATPEWLGPWWRAYGGDKELLALVFRQGETVVAIFPMFVQRIRAPVWLSIKRLRLVGDGSQDSDDLDFIVRRGYEAIVADSFFAWATTGCWDVCELNCTSTRSLTMKLLREKVAVANWRRHRGERSTLAVTLPRSWERYLKQLSSKERGKIGNRYRYLENHFQLQIRRCEAIEELPVFLEILFGLHQMRWNARGEPGSFALADRRSFYYELATALLRRGLLELWLMELNGNAVAAQIGLRYGDTVHALQEGFHPSYSKESVGYVLRSQVLRYCIEHGVTKYDFLAGDQDSKQRWAAETGQYVDFHFARPGSRGVPYLICAAITRTMRCWLRTHLPPAVLDALISVRKRLHV